MIKYPAIVLLLLMLVSCGGNDPDDQIPGEDNFIRGADLSFLPEIESYQPSFYDSSGSAKNMLDIMKDAGCNTVRLRLWHTPEDAHSGFEEVADFSGRIKRAGMKVYLSVHFSDSWADPGQQAMPDAWKALTLSELKDSVYLYMERIITIIQPEYVSLGNEINTGMLWEQGRIDNGTNLYELLEQAALAIRHNSSSTRIVIHYAGLEGSDWFFNQIKAYHIDYDIIGLSYYPYWHGKSLDSLKTVITALADDFGKPVFICETAYPFTLGWNDWTNNIIGLEEQLIPGYPATPAGQLEYLTALRNCLESSTNSIGFCYWGGEWVAFKGTQATDGSSWENQALFDFENKALPVLQVFNK